VSLATSLVDPLLFYRGLRRDRDAAHRLTRFCTESIKAFGDAMLAAGADVVCIADPSATGEIIGRAAFEEFVLPYVNGLTRYFRDVYQAPSIVHICGNVKSLGEALASVEAEAVSVDSVVGIGTLGKLAPGRLTMGNISTFLLEKGTPEEISKASRRCLAEGVDILAPACGIGPRTPVANIRAMYEAVAGVGRR
jgi:[methyl-Co(III) methanol-specific corrinoid protein]:coenzyme M methyltransferase